MNKTCVLLKVGTYEGLTFTPEILRDIEKNFNEMPLSAGFKFKNTVLDGQLGKLLKVEFKDDTLYGVYEVPDWVDSVFTGNTVGVAVSQDLKLVKAALVEKPYKF